jgi:hypothetical protein
MRLLSQLFLEVVEGGWSGLVIMNIDSSRSVHTSLWNWAFGPIVLRPLGGLVIECTSEFLSSSLNYGSVWFRREAKEEATSKVRLWAKTLIPLPVFAGQLFPQYSRFFCHGHLFRYTTGCQAKLNLSDVRLLVLLWNPLLSLAILSSCH